jgi:hypothetical protein
MPVDPRLMQLTDGRELAWAELGDPAGYLLMLVGADRAEAEQVLGRLRHRWAGVGEPVGFSAGIASGEQDLMPLADEHMYANKRSRDLPAD